MNQLILRRTTAVVIGTVLVGAVAACAPQPTEAGVTTLTSSALGYQIAANWNPVTSNYLNLYFGPQQTVYEPIIGLNSGTFEYEPILAESFEIADDLHSMDIVLRQDVDFTDGTHLDAEVLRSYLDAITEGPTNAYFFERFALDLEVTGDYELTISTALPMDSDFMYGLALIPIASPTAIEEDPTGLERTPVGTGPYILDEQVPEVSASFVRNPDYRDPEAFDFDEMKFVVFADPIAASNALKTGQINVASLDPALAADAESAGFAIHTGGGFNYALTWTDLDGAIVPQLTDARVRQAIAYSLDREAITDSILRGYGSINSQAWGPGSPYYLEGEDDRYAFDVERARALMAEAGYEAGFSMRMPTWSSLAPYDPVLMQSFADIGITLTFDQYPDIDTYTEATVEYALSMAQWGDLYLDARSFPETADLYEIVDTGTADEVDAALQEIGEIVLDEAFVISVARPLDVWATVPEITMDVGIITGWPPTLKNFRLAD